MNSHVNTWMHSGVLERGGGGEAEESAVHSRRRDERDEAEMPEFRRKREGAGKGRLSTGRDPAGRILYRPPRDTRQMSAYMRREAAGVGAGRYNARGGHG